MAAIRGEYKMVKMLLESGEDVDQRDQVLVFGSLLCCEISPFGAFPLRSVCVPFINMHKGRVYDVTHFYNLWKKYVSPY